MTTSKTETTLDWLMNILGLAGGIPGIIERFGKLWGNIPEETKKQIEQKMPGFLGLSLADEQIFNALVGELSLEKQRLIMKFLFAKCQKFQRNRFINIVAGMEVIQGSPTIIEKKMDKAGNIINEKTTATQASKDLRLGFLKKFASYIKAHGIDEAYAYCIGGRMVMEDPFYQQAVTLWSESISWLNVVLGNSVPQQTSSSVNNPAEEKAREYFKNALEKRRKK